MEAESLPAIDHHVAHLLRNRAFVLLWLGLLVSSVGDWINYVAMLALVFSSTHSALALAALRLCHILPILLLAPFAGVFVDRWSRRRILIVAPAVAGVAAGLLALVHPVWAVFVAYGAITIALTVYNPAWNALLPNLISQEDLVAANALSQITGTVSIVFGGTAGGLIVAGLGPSLAFAINAVSFFFIAACVFGIPVVEERIEPAVVSFATELREGISAITQRAEVGVIILASGVFVFPIATVLTLGIALVQGQLHAPASGYGIVLLGLGVGSLVGVVWSISYRAGVRQELALVGGGVVLGIGTVLMGLSQSVPFAAAAYGVAGCGEVVAVVAAVSLLQRLVPNALRGRVFAVQSTVDHLGAFISTLVVGAAAGAVGAGNLIALSGVVAVAAGGYAFWSTQRGEN